MPEVVSVASASENTLESEILSFLATFEWMHLKYYWDYKQYSIWYWTPSYKWEVITKEEAEKRAYERINRELDRYNLRWLDINHQKAIVSFVYNIWSLTNSQRRMINNWYYCALWNNFLLYINAWWKPLEWLRRRRQRERNLLCK
jgi:GH24 family phage-related lysozyme (muramidase)